MSRGSPLADVSGICKRCGGQMVPGVPGDVYCPNDECFQADLREAMNRAKEWEKQRRYAKYLELKKEFGDG